MADKRRHRGRCTSSGCGRRAAGAVDTWLHAGLCKCRVAICKHTHRHTHKKEKRESSEVQSAEREGEEGRVHLCT